MLIERLKQDHKAARLSKDEVLSGLLGTLIGDAETLARAKEIRPPTDDEVSGLLRKFTKGAREMAEAYRTRGDSPDGLAQAEREIAIMAAYLPAQADPEAVRTSASAFKDANPGANVGAIMAHLKGQFGAGLDGKAASVIVKGL